MNIDGVEIFVDKVQGNGEVNFVLIHNAGGDHKFFTHQIEMLKKYGDIILKLEQDSLKVFDLQQKNNVLIRNS